MPVPVFSVNEVLTSSAMNQVGLWRVSTCTVTSVGGTAATASNGVITLGNGNTSVTVNNAFSSNFHGYLIKATNGAGSVPANVSLQLGNSVTGYFAGGNVWSVTGVSSNIPDNNAASFTRAGQMTAAAFNLNVMLNNPQLAKHTQIVFDYNIYDATSGTTNFGGGTGTHAVATSYTSFTLTPGSGSFSSGTIRVYGYRL